MSLSLDELQAIQSRVDQLDPLVNAFCRRCRYCRGSGLGRWPGFMLRRQCAVDVFIEIVLSDEANGVENYQFTVDSPFRLNSGAYFLEEPIIWMLSGPLFDEVVAFQDLARVVGNELDDAARSLELLTPGLLKEHGDRYDRSAQIEISAFPIRTQEQRRMRFNAAMPQMC